MQLKKIGNAVLDFIEIVIPALSFLTLFIVFLVGIVTRYILKEPAPWTMEVSVLAYMWVVFFGAAWCTRTDSNVVFSLCYDALPQKAQRWFRLLQNSIVTVFLLIAFVPFSKRILKMSTSTGVLSIPFRWAYVPFIVMMALVILHCVRQIVEDFRGRKEIKG